MTSDAVDVVAGSGSDGVWAEDGVGARMRWGAVFAGAVAALALWVLLSTFGLALGLSTLESDDPGSVKSSGLFTGIFGLISPLLALFVGGMVAGRTAGVLDRVSGGLHGLVVWGLTTLLGAWMVVSLLAGVVGGIASAGKSALSAGAGAIGQVAGNAQGVSQVPAALGIDADDALRPVNQRLAAEGKPPVTAAQLQATMKDVVQQGLQGGRVDREALVQLVAQNTALTRADAEQVSVRLEQQIQQARDRASARIDSATATAKTGALEAADATGKAFWGVFGALLLGMIASIVGAALGSARQRRQYDAIRGRERQGLRTFKEQPGSL